MQGWEEDDFELDFDVGDLLRKGAAPAEKQASFQANHPVVAEPDGSGAVTLEPGNIPQPAQLTPDSKRSNEGAREGSVPKKPRAADVQISVAEFLADMDWDMEQGIFNTPVGKTGCGNGVSSSTNLSSDECSTQCTSQKLAYTIPGPAGAVQLGTNSYSQRYNSFVDSLQPDACDESSDYKTRAWMKALEFFRSRELALTTIIQIKASNIERVPQMIAIIKTCTPNGCGDAYVTLKDPTGTISGTIHRNVIAETEFGRDIVPEAVILLCKVTIFRPGARSQYLNITIHNVAQVFRRE